MLSLAVVLETGDKVVFYSPDQFLSLLKSELDSGKSIEQSFSIISESLKDKTRYI